MLREREGGSDKKRDREERGEKRGEKGEKRGERGEKSREREESREREREEKREESREREERREGRRDGCYDERKYGHQVVIIVTLCLIIEQESPLLIFPMDMRISDEIDSLSKIQTKHLKNMIKKIDKQV